MFELLCSATLLAGALAMVLAYSRYSDPFHPVMFIAPMMMFLYGWMPLRLLYADELRGYFDNDQLNFVQAVNVLGVVVFLAACLSAPAVPRRRRVIRRNLPLSTVRRLVAGAVVAGSLGLTAWVISIVNVGGLYNAFSNPYSGGWDDSGYVRDGSILLLAGVVLLLASIAYRRPFLHHYALLALFTIPWAIQAILTARRGPTFALAIVLVFGWYLNRERRPSLIAVCAGGALAGYLILFLVTNRQSIHLGSDLDLSTDVSSFVEVGHTGNEYIYGTGSLLSADRRSEYFWGKRYLAQVLVRPIPSAVWPNKYADSGVPELLTNAGTGEGIADTLGWVGAPGAAPGIVADLWIEASWLAIPTLAAFGWLYGWAWRKSVVSGQVWTAMYTVMAALSLYFVMQTMEAVIFRYVLVSIPVTLTWKWALRDPANQYREALERAEARAMGYGI